jgi:hypothetical protein
MAAGCGRARAAKPELTRLRGAYFCESSPGGKGRERRTALCEVPGETICAGGLVE